MDKLKEGFLYMPREATLYKILYLEYDCGMIVEISRTSLVTNCTKERAMAIVRELKKE